MLAELALVVRDEGAARDLYRMSAEDAVELGPFRVSSAAPATPASHCLPCYVCSAGASICLRLN